MKKNRFRHTRKERSKLAFIFTIAGSVLFLLLGTWAWGGLSSDPLTDTPLSIKKELIRFKNFRPKLEHLKEGKYISQFKNGITASYTIDQKIQQRIENYFERYKVPYGSFVAMSPKTGKILALVDYSAREPKRRDLAFQASYPAASIFKLVTAAAAIEEKQISPDHSISYRGQFNRLRPAYWEDHPKKDKLKMSVSDALARSNNVVFAKIANRWLDIPTLLDYGERFYFNRSIPFESQVQMSRMEIYAKEGALENTAAGFGKVGLSPLHAVLIGSAIANNGTMMTPCMVDHVINTAGEILYECRPKVLKESIRPETAAILRKMMGKTVRNGTVKNIFRRRYRDPSIRKVKIGGKTGSLRGKTPKGRYTWFIAMAPLENPEIVVAAMVVNDPVWHIKAPQVAKEGLTAYFDGLSK